MIDKISSNGPVSYSNGVNPVERSGATPDQNSRQIDQRAAEVTLSAEALALSRTVQAAKEGPEVRTDKVEAIKNQVAAGTYRVDANALADKLLPFLK
ncbi:MAG: flagellar biosynthesis anti-sigma factor FlgM [Anaerolineae bacterium]|nr:flagellar biosynthesis anti-sigma factor FlgM [Anaerolineae bacterium]